MNKFFTLILFCCCFSCSSFKSGSSPKNLSVFQLNIWQEGTMVNGGFDAIVNEIIDKNADVVMLSEVRNYKEQDFVQRLVQALKAKNSNYYGVSSPEKLDVAILSKNPILEQKPFYSTDSQMGGVLKTKINIEGQQLVFYAVHLDYTNYACYLPRGYDGVTWKKMPNKITDVNQIMEANRKSKRDEAIKDIIVDAKKEATNQTIIIAGDFNEPSHLDWAADTKDLFDHSGAIVPWDCSTLLAAAGFQDAFRVKFPNPVTHPGFTFAAFNKDVALEKLVWAPDADDRDRIDFIYYLSATSFKMKSIKLVGPQETIKYGIKQNADSEDEFFLPKGIWPSDHKGLLAHFTW